MKLERSHSTKDEKGSKLDRVAKLALVLFAALFCAATIGTSLAQEGDGDEDGGSGYAADAIS